MTESADDAVSVQCPYCGEWQSILLDPESIGEMVQDCEVCCEPWDMTVLRNRSGAVTVRLLRMD
jgi:hypothetical protein